MKFLVLLTVCSVGLVAQTAIIPTAQLCPAGKIGSYTVTGMTSTYSLLKFTCIDPPVSNCSSLVARVETFIPSPSINLSFKPAPNTVLLVFFNASRVGFSKSTAIANPGQQINLTFPSYDLSLDEVTFVYWSAP